MQRSTYALIPAHLDGHIDAMTMSSQPLRGLTIDIDLETIFLDYPLGMRGDLLIALLMPQLVLARIVQDDEHHQAKAETLEGPRGASNLYDPDAG